MKQIIQDLKSGATILEEVPAPQVKAGYVLIKTTRTLVSLGTERMLVEFGKANLIDKARQQPDRVKQVLDKIRTDGMVPTLEAVFNKLNQPLPLGYCNVGKVVAVGKGVTEFSVGDRVASNGNHAEYVCVPKNLVAKVPDNVSDEEAAFTVIGSIGLEGVKAELMEECCVQEQAAVNKNTADIMYEGVKNTVIALSKKVNFYVVSNCQSGYIELMLEKTGLEPYVKDFECFGNTGKGKADNLKLLIERNGLKTPVYIGDTDGDCTACKAAAVPFIWASYGFGLTKDFFAELNSFEKLSDVIFEG